MKCPRAWRGLGTGLARTLVPMEADIDQLLRLGFDMGRWQRTNIDPSQRCRCRSRTGKTVVEARRFWRRDQKDLPKGGGMIGQEAMGGPVGRSWEEMSSVAWPSIYLRKVGHYTAAISIETGPARLDILSKALLKLHAHYRQGFADVLSPSVGLGCPLHKIPYTRGSVRPFESERNCWLR